jgi:hypothetical protein
MNFYIILFLDFWKFLKYFYGESIGQKGTISVFSVGGLGSHKNSSHKNKKELQIEVFSHWE